MNPSTQAYATLIALFVTTVLLGAVKHPTGRVAQANQAGHEATGLRIDVNTADAATLTLLPGIGPGIADHIIQARQGGMHFQSEDDLETVKHIGPKLIVRIGPWVTYD